jgi:P pilus assembly chaperone PapD
MCIDSAQNGQLILRSTMELFISPDVPARESTARQALTVKLRNELINAESFESLTIFLTGSRHS